MSTEKIPRFIPGGWWDYYGGYVAEILFADSEGWWTRDTGPQRRLKPINPVDAEVLDVQLPG